MTKQDSLKKEGFFQNEYVGNFARVIAGKEIIFLNLILSIESGAFKICRLKYQFYYGVSKKIYFLKRYCSYHGA